MADVFKAFEKIIENMNNSEVNCPKCGCKMDMYDLASDGFEDLITYDGNSSAISCQQCNHEFVVVEYVCRHWEIEGVDFEEVKDE